MKSRHLGRDTGAQKAHWAGGPQSSVLPPRTLSSLCLQFPGYLRVGDCSRSDTKENFPPLCVLAYPPPHPRTRFSRESAHPARGRRAGADGRLLSPARRDRPRGLSCQRRSSSLLRFASECGCRPRPEEPPGPKLQFTLQWVKPELSIAPMEETHPLSPALERGVYPAPTTRQQLAKAKPKTPVFK